MVLQRRVKLVEIINLLGLQLQVLILIQHELARIQIREPRLQNMANQVCFALRHPLVERPGILLIALTCVDIRQHVLHRLNYIEIHFLA